MAISFPSSPTTNQTYTYNNKIWTYNGTRWVTSGANLVATNSPVVPITAANTAPGATTTGSIWIDTDSGALSVYVGGAWVLPSAGIINLADNAITTNAIADGAVTASKLAAGAAVPSQTGQTGKYLTTDGNSASWATVNSLPTQTSNTGKYLTTDGTTASWSTVSAGTTAARAVGLSLIFGMQ